MNNERYNQIIDEVYEKWIYESWNRRIYPNLNEKEQFINRIKTEQKFSERWGLKIEEIKLNIEERNKWSWDNWGITCEMESVLDDEGVPSKLITVTYKDEKTEVYEENI